MVYTMTTVNASSITKALKDIISPRYVQHNKPDKKLSYDDAMDKPICIMFRKDNRVLEKFSISYMIKTMNNNRYITDPKFGFRILDVEYNGVQAIQVQRNHSTNPNKTFIVSLEDISSAAITLAYKAKRGVIYIDLKEDPLSLETET